MLVEEVNQNMHRNMHKNMHIANSFFLTTCRIEFEILFDKNPLLTVLYILPYTNGMTKDPPDPLMARLQMLFNESRLTLDELGQRMGYTGPTTRASAWQFLNRTNDPRLSMLRKFARAVGVPVADLFAEEKKNGRSK